MRCNRIEHWAHLRWACIRQSQHTATWTCHIHRQSGLTTHITDITQPHPSRPLSEPPTHSPPTPLTPPQPKYRHTSNTPPVPTGLVKPKPNPFIHSPPSPPTPPRDKHILFFLKRRFIEINKTIYRIVENKDIRNTFRVKRNEREESMAAMMIIK